MKDMRETIINERPFEPGHIFMGTNFDKVKDSKNLSLFNEDQDQDHTGTMTINKPNFMTKI